MNTLEKVGAATALAVARSAAQNPLGAVCYSDVARAALEALLEPSEELMDRAAYAAFLSFCGLRSGDPMDSWPYTGLSAESHTFIACAKIAHAAMIQAALDGK